MFEVSSVNSSRNSHIQSKYNNLNYKNTILVYEVKLDHIYPGNVRDPQQKAKAAHRQNNQLLPLKNVQKLLAKAVHDESHSHFHHGKLHSVHANIL